MPVTIYPVVSMNKVALFVCFAIFSATALLAQIDPEMEELILEEKRAHQYGTVFSTRDNKLTGSDFDMKYYRFEWEINPAVRVIKGTATLYFESRIDNFRQLQLELSSKLKVSEVRYAGNSLLSFSQSGAYALNITLPAVLAKGVMDSISIFYAGVPPENGFGSFVQSNHSGAPILWTLSEPYGSRDWWPCKNGLDDKIDSIDVIISTPKANRAASNGLLVKEVENGANKVYHWKHRYPIAPYLVAIAVTNYVQYTDQVLLSDGTVLPMLNYVYPESENTARAGTANLVRVLQLYDSLFGAYPFLEEKYGHAQFGWGGGMEHQTMSFVTNFGWTLLTHELAHMWFGDLVTCGSWSDIWLNEGFATYLEGLSRERFPALVNPKWYDWKLGKLNSIVSQSGGSVWVDDTSSVDRIFSGRLSYNKGAYLLHMLRWELGDQAFFQGVRDYLRKKSYGFVRTPDLQNSLEAVSGKDLDEFFEDWLYGQGYPRYRVIWDQSDQGELYLRLSQSPTHPSVDFFELNLPLLLKGPGVDSLIRLEHVHNNQTFIQKIPFRVNEIIIDPDLWILCAFNQVSKGALVAADDRLDYAEAVVYPNPVQDIAHIAGLPDDLTGNMNWKILDLLGRPVRSGTWKTNDSAINCEGLSEGLYKLRLEDAKGRIWSTTMLKK